MATTLKSEKIIVGIDDQVVELVGKEKDDFIAQREADNLELQLLKGQTTEQKTLKVSAYTKLGLTEEEINAIL